MKLLKGIALLLLLFTIACGDEDPEPIGAFDNGLLVLNEGAFNSGNSSLSFINADGEVEQQVFATANEGLALGDIAQSITETDRHFLVVVNNSNVLYALTKSDLSIDYTLDDLSLPRYVTTQGSTGYVTEWVSFTEQGRVTAFDLETGAILNQQTVGFGAEFPYLDGELLYVSNNFEATLTVLNATSLEVIETISTGPSPSQIKSTQNGELWLLCTGGFDENFAPANNGVFQRLSSGQIVATVNLNQNVGSRFATSDNALYYYTGTQVWEVAADRQQLTEYLSDDEVMGYYGIAIDDAGILYMTDNNGFQGTGSVIKYTSGGLRDAEYQVGIGPNSVLVR